MFYTIFAFEIRYWFRKPSFYIYSGILFLLTTFLMATSAGFFESLTVSMNTITIVNSASYINQALNEMAIIVYFLLPAIIGGTIYKDYKHEMHSVLYSYPFTKLEYLTAKFVSGLSISILVVAAAALGIFVGSIMPGTNPELLEPFKLANYVQPFLYYIIPNLIFFGAIVFAIVTFSRNINTGFIAILAIFLIQIFSESLTQDLDNKTLAAILDPYGFQANQHYTEYWTVYERNENSLPWGEIILYNRLLWTGLGLLILGMVYKCIQFHPTAILV